MNKLDYFKKSYDDALEDYLFSCTNLRSNRWDYIILTASNSNQAKSYIAQIEKRREENRLPLGTEFAVISDYKDERIGSGGATLNVIRYLCEEMPISEVLKKKVLVIHSGGDSKRIPQYSVCGKIFAPVPRLLPNGYVSTIFDELIIASSIIPNRCGSGMMIFPSDTELLFNPLQLDLISCDAAGLSMKAPVLEGTEHGVFVSNNKTSDKRNKDVSIFLHKQPKDVLYKKGAVDEFDQVDIDTGCIWFSNKIINELFKLISSKNEIDINKFNKLVNKDVCLNFYADFVYPLASDSSLNNFLKEAPETSLSKDLLEARKEIWNRLHKYQMSLVKMVPASYIHFGMTHEMYDLFVKDIEEYKYLGWDKRVLTNANKGSIINSYVSSDSIISDDCYIEDSNINNSKVGKGCILSNVELNNKTIPDNVVMHTIKLINGKYVCRIFGKNDNPKLNKDSKFLDGSLSLVIKKYGIDEKDIWDTKNKSLWKTNLYIESDDNNKAIDNALMLHKIIELKATKKEVETWLKSKRYSLESSFNNANVLDVIEHQQFITDKVEMAKFIEDIQNGKELKTIIDNFNVSSSSIYQIIIDLDKKSKKEKFPLNMRLYLSCGDLCKKYGIIDEKFGYSFFEDKAYKSICDAIIDTTFKHLSIKDNIKFEKDKEIVKLPVRVNFCGSPSDAAPYCLEHGGTMIDGALLLKGKKPISVTIKKLKQHVIKLSSIDQGCSQIFDNLDDIRNCSNPYDSYALHKACLVATRIIPIDNPLSMEDLCKKLGGGLEVITHVDVPKGSGLGTSSIIAAAILKAISNIFDLNYSDQDIYSGVFLVEQLMSTGGGWQDQVGGLTEGIKYFTAKPGIYQEIEVDNLVLDEETKKELHDRFCLIFSGQRRLARNVLREEMNKCIRNNQDALEAIDKIQEYCASMRYYLLKGDVTSFAKYITKQFDLVKKLDKGSSNTCIEYIFDVCDDLIDGKAICGAGGGGFLQVILKKGVSKQMLKDRIKENFVDCGVEVWDCQLI